MRKILVIIITLLIGTTTVFAARFSDTTGHWAERVIEEMAAKGILNGFEDGTFKPNASVTREQFAKILVESLKFEKIGDSLNYEDVENDRWSSDYIQKVTFYLDNYRINGKNYFKPSEPSKREDVAVAVVRAKGLERETPNYDLLKQFSDEDKISEDLKSYIAIAVEYGIMQGKGGYFDPQGNLTRAEVSQLLYNVMKQTVNSNDMIKEINKIEKWLDVEEEEFRIDGRTRKFIIWDGQDRRILLLVQNRRFT